VAEAQEFFDQERGCKIILKIVVLLQWTAVGREKSPEKGERRLIRKGHMSHIGRIGGKKSAGRKKQGSQAPPALPTDDARNPQRGEMETHIAESSENHPAEDAA
jgi:hypothetical protein